MKPFTILLLGALASASVLPKSNAAPEALVYFGTYTGPKSKGIYVSKMDLTTGALSSPELAAEVASPSFLAIHPNGKLVYSANEISNYRGEKSGGVSAFAIDRATGKLSLLNQESSHGAGPCHLVVDKAGKNVLVANYGGGSIACLPLETDGKLRPASAKIQHSGSSVNPQRQKEPHAHSINLDPKNKFAVAADLGLDKLLIYRFDSGKGALTQNDPPFAAVKPGAGPRHFAFHPRGKFAYVINEMQMTVTAFDCNGIKGVLTETQTISTLPPDAKINNGYSTAEVQVHPSGKFVFGSNRGHDTIVAYRVDQKTGRLTWVENESTQGKTPRNFGIDPSGKFLLAANQNSDTVVVLKIDPKTGELSPAGHSIQVPTPVCVKFVK